MEESIATLNPSNVLGTTAKFFRVLEGEGVKWSHYQRPIDSKAARRNLAEHLKLGCPKLNEDSLAATTATSCPFFANEEAASSYGYPQGYAVKPVCEQLFELSKHFPSLDTSSVLAYSKELPSLPQGAEEWFAVPRFEKVAGTYNDAVEKVLELIAKTHTFYNYRKGKLGPKNLKLSERTAVALQMLGEDQKGDFLLIPAQFGITHRGRSVRRVRVIYAPHEFGLDAFAVGSMLLAHPERLVQWEQLHIDCPGDEYTPDGDRGFSSAPYFDFFGGWVGFGTRWIDDPGARYSSVSGFVPQS